MSEANLQYVPRVSKNTDILIANFTNGRLQDPTCIKFASFEGTSSSVKSKPKRKLVAETDHLQYAGQNTGLLASRASNYVKHLVGVLDKLTGKMKLMDASIMNLKPYFPDRDKPDSDDDDDDVKLTLTEKSDMLTSAFGSGKKKRAMSTRHRYLTKGSAVDRAVETAMESVQTETLQASQIVRDTTDGGTDAIPPFNKDAETPDKVYDFNSIIFPAIMESLIPAASVFTNVTREQMREWRNSGEYPGYILGHLSMLPVEDTSRLHRAQCLFYLNCLIKLYHTRAPQLKKGIGILPDDTPDAVKKSIFDQFTVCATGTGNSRPLRMMPARMKDKLISYILVLCLILDEFNLEFTTLQQDIKIGVVKISTHFRALGCRVKSEKIAEMPGMPKLEVRTAVLTVPLTFPEPSKGRAKKK